MSTWRKRFSRKSQRLNENDEILLNNTVKYRKKLQSAITQISRTKKSVQRNFDSPDSEIHVARLINDIGQLSDCKALQEISGLIDSLAMRRQLSSRIFNEYAMNSLQQSLRKLNENLSNDFDKTKSVLDEAVTNHCSDHTKKQLLTKVQIEWSKHQNFAIKEFKHGLASYCDIGLYNLKLQTTILEKLQNFLDQLPDDNHEMNNGLPNFPANSVQTRHEVDTMLRVMLDTAPNDSASLPAIKQPKFLNSLYSPEITQAAAARSHGPVIPQRNQPFSSQYPAMVPTAPATNAQTLEHESTIITPNTPQNGRFQIDTSPPDDDSLPSYTDLFIVPSNCKGDRTQHRNSQFKNQ